MYETMKLAVILEHIVFLFLVDSSISTRFNRQRTYVFSKLVHNMSYQRETVTNNFVLVTTLAPPPYVTCI